MSFPKIQQFSFKTINIFDKINLILYLQARNFMTQLTLIHN